LASVEALTMALLDFDLRAWAESPQLHARRQYPHLRDLDE